MWFPSTVFTFDALWVSNLVPPRRLEHVAASNGVLPEGIVASALKPEVQWRVSGVIECCDCGQPLQLQLVPGDHPQNLSRTHYPTF